jgi:hypothetical protein
MVMMVVMMMVMMVDTKEEAWYVRDNATVLSLSFSFSFIANSMPIPFHSNSIPFQDLPHHHHPPPHVVAVVTYSNSDGSSVAMSRCCVHQK